MLSFGTLIDAQAATSRQFEDAPIRDYPFPPREGPSPLTRGLRTVLSAGLYRLANALEPRPVTPAPGRTADAVG